MMARTLVVYLFFVMCNVVGMHHPAIAIQGVNQEDLPAIDFKKITDLAEHGDMEAQAALGWAYSTGLGIQQDETQAASWFRKAAEQGHALGQAGLGVLYAHGRGIPQDYNLAVTWLRKAAEQGIMSSQALLGAMYSLGLGVPQDYRQAYAWLSVAAANGDRDAISARDEAAEKLTPSALSNAQVLAAEYFEKY